MLGVRFFFFGCNNSFCGCNISFCSYNISFCGCNISFCGYNISFCGCNISFCSYNISFCGYNISFCGCNISFFGCNISFFDCNISFCGYNNSFCGYNISFCGYNISFCGCNNSKSDCYILFSACSKSKRDLCFSYATTYNLVDAFLSFKVLHETDAQRSRGFVKFQIRTCSRFENFTNPLVVRSPRSGGTRSGCNPRERCGERSGADFATTFRGFAKERIRKTKLSI